MNGTTQGFTLIELLIVIAIIGILAVVLLPNLLGAQKRAYDTSALTCANNLAKAIAIHRVDNPTTSNTLAASDYFDTNEKNELYGAGSKVAKTGCGVDDLVVKGDADADGKYSFTVTHKRGNNTYTLKPSGITNAKQQPADLNP